jgi:hypothetical protein
LEKCLSANHHFFSNVLKTYKSKLLDKLNKWFKKRGQVTCDNPENPVSTEALDENFWSLVVLRYSRRLAEGAIESFHNLTDYEDMAQTFKDLTQITHKGDVTHDRNQSA